MQQQVQGAEKGEEEEEKGSSGEQEKRGGTKKGCGEKERERSRRRTQAHWLENPSSCSPCLDG